MFIRIFKHLDDSDSELVFTLVGESVEDVGGGDGGVAAHAGTDLGHAGGFFGYGCAEGWEGGREGGREGEDGVSILCYVYSSDEGK